MIRTQLYIPDEMMWELRFLAEKFDVSVSEFIRKAIARGIVLFKKKEKGILDGIVGMVKFDSAPKDLSSNLDKYLY